MSRFKDFDAARAEEVGEPLTFRLAGRDFTVERVPAGPLLDLAASADAVDTDALVAFSRFLLNLVLEDQRDDMKAALDETDLPTLLAIVQWVVQEATSVPLDGRSSSADASSETGPSSRVVSLSPKEARSA